jgi:hypothetical protein
MMLLQDRGEMSSTEGQKSVAILLFEDLMIVPLLALVALMSPLSQERSGWSGILIALAALLALLAVSRWGLNTTSMFLQDDPKAALQIVEMAQREFPQAKLLVRSYDRAHTIELIRAGVDYQIRETVESAYLMGAEGLRALGYAQVDVEEAASDIRRRDAERLSEQVQGNAMSGLDRLHFPVIPEPLHAPSASKSLSK